MLPFLSFRVAKFASDEKSVRSHYSDHNYHKSNLSIAHRRSPRFIQAYWRMEDQRLKQS